MTIAAFLIGGAAAWAHFHWLGWKVAAGLTVWVAWMGLVSIAALIDAIRSREAWRINAALVLLIAFVASNLIWQAAMLTLETQALKNVAVSGALVMIALVWRAQPPLVAMVLYALCIAAAMLKQSGLMFDGRRPLQFIAWSYPDVAAGLQHAALLALSLPRRMADIVGSDSWAGIFTATSRAEGVAGAVRKKGEEVS